MPGVRDSFFTCDVKPSADPRAAQAILNNEFNNNNHVDGNGRISHAFGPPTIEAGGAAQIKVKVASADLANAITRAESIFELENCSGPLPPQLLVLTADALNLVTPGDWINGGGVGFGAMSFRYAQGTSLAFAQTAGTVFAGNPPLKLGFPNVNGNPTLLDHFLVILGKSGPAAETIPQDDIELSVNGGGTPLTFPNSNLVFPVEDGSSAQYLFWLDVETPLAPRMFLAELAGAGRQQPFTSYATAVANGEVSGSGWGPPV